MFLVKISEMHLRKQKVKAYWQGFVIAHTQPIERSVKLVTRSNVPF